MKRQRILTEDGLEFLGSILASAFAIGLGALLLPYASRAAANADMLIPFIKVVLG